MYLENSNSIQERKMGLFDYTSKSCGNFYLSSPVKLAYCGTDFSGIGIQSEI
jgi:hypothetical protein